MTASPLTVTNYPLYLNSRTNIYPASEFRRPWDDVQIGPGVLDYDSFRVRQRVAGLNQSVDVVAASVLNRAWVRSSIALSDAVGATADGGLYRVDYNSSTILNLDVSAADGANPRIDSVYLAVEDQQVVGSNNTATIRLVTGTPTGGATLDNRTGAGAAPAGMASILLADILVPALSASVPTANIRDRRPVTGTGTVPWLGAFGTQIDQVSFVPHPMHAVTQGQILTTGSDNTQCACLMYLPRRIVGATRLRWKYAQGSTANANNYAIGIYDASGRLITGTAVTAATGALNTIQVRSEPLLVTTTFEVGWYYILFGAATLTASSNMDFGTAIASSVSISAAPGMSTPGIVFFIAGGGSALPQTLAALTDSNARVTVFNCTPVPVPSLSVT